jgi:hypothetical protein
VKKDPVSEAARLMGQRGGKKGGRKGGKKRMAALTPEQRQELARKAARARWDRQKRKKS